MCYYLCAHSGHLFIKEVLIMANKRTIEKNKPTRKTLRENEFYNPQTRRYEYRYKDTLGKDRVISSYTLEPTDNPPKGKRSSKSLREKEEELKIIHIDKVDFDGCKLTLLQVVNQYLSFLYNKKKLAHNTKVGYSVTINCLKNYRLAHMQISKIRPEHCEEWLAEMKKHYRGSSIQTQISLIKRSFEYAIDHDYILKNPFRNISTDRSDSKIMDAVPFDDMQRFLDFCSTDSHSKHCYDMIYIMFWTGIRPSELCGITLDDVDFENRIIHIKRQLMCINKQHVVSKPKTKNGIRCIPMTDGVYEHMKSVVKNRYIKGDVEPVCYDENGKAYSGFVFLATRSRRTITRSHVEEYLRNCISRFNAKYPDNKIDKFEPYGCRHTFATNMQDLPPKTLQYVMGHGSIATTMKHYVSVKPQDKQLNEVNNIASELVK